MGLKKAENQVKILLAETILSMCRNTLPYHAEICVEGLLGITLDNEEIFLVNINQTIKNQIEGPSAASKANESLKRSRKEQDNEGSESDPESSSNESEESSSKKRRKRGRRKKQKGEKSGSESDDGNLADESANVEATSLLPGADLTEVKFHNISPPDENPDGSEQYYDNSNQTADNDSQDATPSGVNVTVKQEPPGGPESDDDLVFVKQEVDDFNLAQPSSHQFSNLSQVFGNSSADTSLSQPDFMSSAFFNNPANNMSANAMQQAAVPGPSGANADESPLRPFRCPVCGRSFNRPKKVEEHLRVHMGQRPYVCHLCPKSFALKGNLDRHKRHVHGLLISPIKSRSKDVVDLVTSAHDSPVKTDSIKDYDQQLATSAGQSVSKTKCVITPPASSTRPFLTKYSEECVGLDQGIGQSGNSCTGLSQNIGPCMSSGFDRSIGPSANVYHKPSQGIEHRKNCVQQNISVTTSTAGQSVTSRDSLSLINDMFGDIMDKTQ